MQHSLKKEEFNFNKNSWSLNYEYFKIEINEDDFKNEELKLFSQLASLYYDNLLKKCFSLY